MRADTDKGQSEAFKATRSMPTRLSKSAAGSPCLCFFLFCLFLNVSLLEIRGYPNTVTGESTSNLSNCVCVCLCVYVCLLAGNAKARFCWRGRAQTPQEWTAIDFRFAGSQHLVARPDYGHRE